MYFIYQSLIHKTGYQSSATESEHIPARLLLHFPDFFYTTNDRCRLPFYFVQSLERTIWGILSARRAYAFSFSVPILELARRESQYCSYPGYIRRPRISASTEFSVSFITFYVSSSSAIAQSISPFGPSIKQSTDVCRAVIIFLIIIFPVRLVQSHYTELTTVILRNHLLRNN